MIHIERLRFVPLALSCMDVSVLLFRGGSLIVYSNYETDPTGAEGDLRFD